MPKRFPLLLAALLIGFQLASAQVANDDCATAQNLGTLPTPQSCTAGPVPTRGQGAPLNFNLTNTNAVPSNPYISMTGCQVGGNMASPARDVWYLVTVTGTELVLNIPNAGLGLSPNVGLWSGTCGSLVGVGCATSNAALNVTFDGLIPGPYYLQISGNNPTDDGNFSLTLQNNNNCAACLTSHTLTVNPLPTNGYYPAGTPVNFCFSVTGWTIQSANWLEGLDLNIGGGWNLASLVPVIPTRCGTSTGLWGFYNSVTATAPPNNTYGPGFFFDLTVDSNPGNDWGDNCNTASPNIGNWDFCFTITTNNNCGSGTFNPDLSITFNTLADGEAGSWGSVACQNDPDVFFSAQITCCPQPTISSTPILCNGQCTGSITATAQGTGPWNYTWINQLTNATIRTQNNVAGPDVLPNVCAGTYIVQTFDQFEGCIARDTVTLTEPAAITSNPTVVNVLCNGGNTGSITMTGTAGGVGGYQYSLGAGPFVAGNAFTGLTAGNYSIRVQDGNGCIVTFAPINITEPAALSGTPFVGDVTCNGGSTGSITIGSVAGGSGPYQYSIDGGLTFVASSVFSGLGAGTYSVIIRDANLCTLTLSNIVVNEPAVISGTPVVVDATCNGGSTGSITINGTAGGVGPYLYSIDGGLTYFGSNVFSGLPAGTYSIVIRDASLCTVTLGNLVMGEPTALSATPAVVNVACNGGNTGSITINAASGGVGPYQYSIDGGLSFGAGNVFSGLVAGSYTVLVRDANLCLLSLTNLVVTEPAQLSGTIASTPASCVPGNDGTVTVGGMAGGVGPYSYNIGSGNQVSPVFNGLAGGNYSVTVSDANLCTLVLPVVVGIPSGITGNATPTDVSCNGGSDGQVVVNASTGNPPLSYSLNGAPAVLTNTFSGLPAGPFSVTLTDNAGCTLVLNGVLNEPATISGSPLVVDATCFGSNDGSITINGASGGNGTFTYDIGSGFGASNVFTGLAPGTYSVTVQDGNNCTAVLSNLVVAEPSQLTAADSIIPVSCMAGNDGEIWVINSAGGTPGYEYSLNSGPFGPGNGFTNLLPGNYTVQVRDLNGCTITLNSVVGQLGGLAATDSIVHPTCNGATDGEVWILTTGGQAPFQYSLNGAPAIAQNNFTGLGAGPVTVTVEDGNNCQLTFTPTLVEPALLTAAISGTDVLCNGGNDGTVQLSGVAGGTPGYTYSLNGGTAGGSSSFTGLVAGAYTIQVQDSNGCTANFGPLVVNEPNALSLLAVATDVSCFGGNDGMIDATGGGGTPAYSFSLDGLTWQTGGIFPGLTAGSYTITLQDSNLCSTTLAITVGSPTALVVSTSSTPSLCGNANGAMDALANGGTPGYSYLWSNGATTSSAINLPAGAYTVTVTDGNGCQDSSAVAVAALNAPSVAITNSVNPLCAGGATGTATATVSGGSSPVSVLWSPGGMTQLSLTGLSAGAYQVVVTDSAGCVDSASVVLQDPAPFVLLADTTAITCFGADDGSIILLPTGGTPGYTFLWNIGSVADSLMNLPPGAYSITATDARGCQDSVSYSFSNPIAIVADFSANPALPGQLVLPNTTVSFNNLSSNATTYLWSFGDGGFASDQHPVHQYSLLGQHCVTLVAMDSSSGCGDTLEKCAFTVVEEVLFIPNTFTPNGDGRNDLFEIVGLGQYPNNHLTIFNRWGNLVYEKEHYNNDWDGRNTQDNKPLPDGGYFYIFDPGEEGVESFQGDVVIFR